MADNNQDFFIPPRHLSPSLDLSNAQGIETVKEFLTDLIGVARDTDTQLNAFVFANESGELIFNYAQVIDENNISDYLLVSDVATVLVEIAISLGITADQASELPAFSQALTLIGTTPLSIDDTTITIQDELRLKRRIQVSHIKNLARQLLAALPTPAPVEEEATAEEITPPPVPVTAEPPPAVTAGTGRAAPTIAQLYSNPEYRKTAAILRTIALKQMGQLYGFPADHQWSDQIPALIDSNLESFLLGLNPEERHELVGADPARMASARLEFIRKFYWQLLHDPTLMGEFQKAADDVGVSDVALDRAEAGDDFDDLVNFHLAYQGDDPDNESFNAFCREAAALEDPLEQKDDNDQPLFHQQLVDVLSQNIPDGFDTAHTPLWNEVIVTSVDALILHKFSPRILDVLLNDSGKFSMIFPGIPNGENFRRAVIPYLKQYWVLRRVELVRAHGEALISNEWQATDPAILQQLEAADPETFHKRVGHFVTFYHDNKDDLEKNGVKGPEDVIESIYGDTASIEDPARKQFLEKLKQEIYQQEIWRQLSAAEKRAAYDFYNYSYTDTELVNLLAAPPRELIYDDLIAFQPERPSGQRISMYQRTPVADGSFTMQARPKTPMAFVRGIGEQKQKADQAVSIAKSLFSRVTGKGKDKATDAIVNSAVQSASTALGAINPALGAVAKIASTKKGRAGLAIAGLGALGLMVNSIYQALTSIGGSIGGLIGAVTGGGIGFAMGGPTGAVVGATGGFMTGATYGAKVIPYKWSDILGKPGTGKALSAAGRDIGSAAGDLGRQALSGGAINSRGLGAFGQVTPTATSFWQTHFADVGVTAPLTAIAVTFAGTAFILLIIQAAFLANFPTTEQLGTYDPETGQVSKYVSIQKTITNVDCPQNTCEDPQFPMNPVYTITIVPKNNYTLTIRDLTDTMTVSFNIEKYEELGQEPAIITDVVRTIDNFSNVTVDTVIGPDQKLVLSYEDTVVFDETYNHSNIVNKFELNFDYEGDGDSGTADAYTSKGLCVGECPVGRGCWPAAGSITQLPGGVPGQSHYQYDLDAYDIATGGINGDPIFAPFSGEVCPGNRGSAYGDHVLLQTTIESDEYIFLFGHMVSGSALTYDNCLNVTEGEIIGRVDHTGYSTGPHLHYELLPSDENRRYTLVDLVPDGVNVVVGNPVDTCSTGQGGSSTPAIASTDMDCPMNLDATNTDMDKEDFLSGLSANFPDTFMDDQWFDYVSNESINAGWNPAVLLALGWEETGWGAVGRIQALGCLGGGNLDTDAPPKEVIDHQLSCIFNNFEPTISCEQFMCQYSGDGDHPCIFDNNPNFAINLPRIYNALID